MSGMIYYWHIVAITKQLMLLGQFWLQKMYLYVDSGSCLAQVSHHNNTSDNCLVKMLVVYEKRFVGEIKDFV